MRSPRNGNETQSPHPLIPNIPTPTPPHFHSTVSLQKLRRFNLLILLFRTVTFSFSLASSIFVLTNFHPSADPPSSWSHFDSFRYVFAANAIVAVYSLLQMVASVWEISRWVTLFPEVVQVWFDFTHDQVFAYLVLSACSAGTTEAKNLKGSEMCKVTSAFCLQSDIAIALGFTGFLFLGFSALLSGFRVVCFIIQGSRCHL